MLNYKHFLLEYKQGCSSN